MAEVLFRPKWVVHLIVFFSVLLVSSPRALAAKSAGDPPQPQFQCEFLLTAATDPIGVVRWIKETTALIKNPDAAFWGYAPKKAAFQALGLPFPYPDNTTMSVESPKGGNGVYWIRIRSPEGEELAHFPFHVPPSAVWKRVKNIEDDEETTLKPDLKKEDPAAISVGALIGDFKRGRKFISIRRRISNLVTVAVGIDVDVSDHEGFSNSSVPILVETGGKKTLSRIEVIKAHFTVIPRGRGLHLVK